VSQGVEVPARGSPEKGDEHLFGEPGNLADGRDPPVVELPGGNRADAPQPFDRERVEKRQLAVGRDHEQPVRLRYAAGHLGEELGPGHPDGDGQANALEDLTPQSHGDIRWRAGDPPQPSDVEERLVDRQPFDQRRRLLEDLIHRLARLGVGRHPRLDHERVGTQPAGLSSTHGRAHPIGLGLVTGREHDPRADDHGTGAQTRVISLLDGRIEGIEVGMQDGGLGRHEQMFASWGDGT
jgi:hypothetical protein